MVPGNDSCGETKRSSQCQNGLRVVGVDAANACWRQLWTWLLGPDPEYHDEHEETLRTLEPPTCGASECNHRYGKNDDE